MWLLFLTEMWLHVPIDHTKHGALMVKVSVPALQAAMNNDLLPLVTAVRHLTRALEQRQKPTSAAEAVAAGKYPAIYALANELLRELHFLAPPPKAKDDEAAAAARVAEKNKTIEEARRHLTTLLRMKTADELEPWIDARAYPTRESGVRELVMYALSGNKKRLTAGATVTGEHKRLYNWAQRTGLALDVDMTYRAVAVHQAFEIIAEEEDYEAAANK